MVLRSDLYGQELVAVKGGGPAEALRREAELLEALDHPGIVRFVALGEDDRGLRLLTRYAGRDTLATWRPRRIEELASVFVDLAEAVRYLHAQGVVHRSIRPAHVVIDAHRRPLLCGFSAARRLEDVDPAAERLADVAAVGATMLGALDGATGQRSRSGRGRDDERLRARLRAVAKAAADGRVPSSRALAGQILSQQGDVEDHRPAGGQPSAVRAAQVDQRRPAPPRGRPRLTGRRLTGRRLTGRPGPAAGDSRAALRRAHRGLRRPRRATLVALAVVCGGCVLGTVMVMRLGAGAAPAPAIPSSAILDGAAASAAPRTGAGGARSLGHLEAGSEAGSSVPDGDTPATPGRAPGGEAAQAPDGDTSACRPVSGGFRDVTGDGCAEEILIASGSVFVDGARYPVGEADDQVAVGDWDCDGIATVAVVQSGGRVYVFDGWPESTEIAGRLVADLVPPVHLTDVTRGVCNELVVRYAEGTWHLPLPGAAS